MLGFKIIFKLLIKKKKTFATLIAAFLFGLITEQYSGVSLCLKLVMYEWGSQVLEIYSLLN